MTKKVALTTLHRVHNFGSALQAYASQELLRESGLVPEIVDYRRPSEYKGFNAQLRYNYARWGRNVATRSAFWALRSRALRREEDNFEAFASRRLQLTSTAYTTPEHLREDPPSADIYCVGSDQVWNNDYHAVGSGSPFYLDFAPPTAPRVSLSSSFGKAEISERDAALARATLSAFRAISVREGSGVAILRRLGLEAIQLVDPTLGHEASFWAGVSSEPSMHKDYILLYQLHRGHDLRASVAAVKKRLNLPVVAIRGFWTPSGSTSRSLDNTSVEEFVGLISNAAYVVTDSFHGTAFSLNTMRPFTTVLPPKYSERIRSVLELTGTSDRALNSVDVASPADGDIDWPSVNASLDTERERLRAYVTSISEC